MKWEGQRESSNVERSGPIGTKGLVIGGGGIGGILLVLLMVFLGGDPSALFNQAPPDQSGHEGPVDPKQLQSEKFVKVILASTEDVWKDLFVKQLGKQYQEPKLFLFRGQVKSACGLASSAVGPFYCPADSNVYLDLQFFDELKSRFKAPGDFAQAYVIAHEVGHHVQNLLRLSDQIDAKNRMETKNQKSVRVELQADFLAGIWGHYAQKRFNWMEPGDIDEAINAARAIGDDRLQKQARGYVVPDSFTHGTSAQRIKWFRLGFETGDFSKHTQLATISYKDL